MNNKIKDLSGNKYDRISVISFNSRTDGVTRWNCVCDCGKSLVLPAPHKYKSCGCLRKETSPLNLRPKASIGADAVKNSMFWYYKNNAEKRNLEFSLSKEHFNSIIEKPCLYCGRIDSKRNRKTKQEFKLNGIDRVDNSKGYIDGNLAPCCETCNRAKLQMNYKEFVDWIELVYNNVRNNDGYI